MSRISPTPAPLRFGRYVRVSSAEQAGPDDTSIETQLRDTANLIAREGGILVETYCDDKVYRSEGRLVQPSGERDDRPEFQRMVSDIRSGKINAVAAWHTWRLYRDYPPFTTFIMAIRGKDIAVRLCTDHWSEQFAVFGAWMGRADNTHRRLQTMKGKQAMARRGFSMAGVSPFYKTVRDDKGKRVGYVLRPDTVDWLQRLAELFLSGLSYKRLAEALQVNPSTGRPLGSTTVQAIVTNPFMRGRIEPGRRSGAAEYSVAGVQPAAWDEATCTAIEAELVRRAQLGRSNPHRGGFLFSGLIRCGLCGYLMSGRHSTSRPTVRYVCPLSTAHKPPRHSQRVHGPNSISEPMLMAQLQALRRYYNEHAAQPAQDAIEQFLVPGTVLKGPSPEQLAKARAHLADLESEYETTPARNTHGRQWLASQVQRAQADLDALEREAARVTDPNVIAEVVGGDIAAFFCSDALDKPPAELRPILLRQFPAIWVKGGKLCKPPETLWITPKRRG